MSDDANDVSKALAAFGAPSIRYHSFGQAQIKPSSVVLPRRVAPVAPEGFALREEVMTVAEPVLVVPPPPVSAPPALELRPAPVLYETEGLRQTEALPPAAVHATIAPPPRPLAEWAAPAVPPATMAPPRPAVIPVPVRMPHQGTAGLPPMPTPPLITAPDFPAPARAPVSTAVPSPTFAAPPAAERIPTVPTAAAPNAPPQTMFGVPSQRADSPSDSAISKKATVSSPRRNLEEVFALLASA